MATGDIIVSSSLDYLITYRNNAWIRADNVRNVREIAQGLAIRTIDRQFALFDPFRGYIKNEGDATFTQITSVTGIQFTGAAYDPDGNLYAMLSDERVFRFDIVDNRYVATLQSIPLPPDRTVGGFAFNPAGNYVYATGVRNRIYTLTNNRWNTGLALPSGVIRPQGIDIAPNGDIYIIASISGTVNRAVYRYTASTSAWSKVADFPRNFQTGAVASNPGAIAFDSFVVQPRVRASGTSGAPTGVANITLGGDGRVRASGTADAPTGMATIRTQDASEPFVPVVPVVPSSARTLALVVKWPDGTEVIEVDITEVNKTLELYDQDPSSLPRMAASKCEITVRETIANRPFGTKLHAFGGKQVVPMVIMEKGTSPYESMPRPVTPNSDPLTSSALPFPTDSELETLLPDHYIYWQGYYNERLTVERNPEFWEYTLQIQSSNTIMRFTDRTDSITLDDKVVWGSRDTYTDSIVYRVLKEAFGLEVMPSLSGSDVGTKLTTASIAAGPDGNSPWHVLQDLLIRYGLTVYPREDGRAYYVESVWRRFLASDTILSNAGSADMWTATKQEVGPAHVSTSYSIVETIEPLVDNNHHTLRVFTWDMITAPRFISVGYICLDTNEYYPQGANLTAIVPVEYTLSLLNEKYHDRKIIRVEGARLGHSLRASWKGATIDVLRENYHDTWADILLQATGVHDFFGGTNCFLASSGIIVDKIFVEDEGGAVIETYALDPDGDEDIALGSRFVENATNAAIAGTALQNWATRRRFLHQMTFTQPDFRIDLRFDQAATSSEGNRIDLRPVRVVEEKKGPITKRIVSSESSRV